MKSIRPTQAYIDETRAAALLEKWAPVLDYSSKSVAPIEDDHTRLNTAMLLENQEQWCIREAGPNYNPGSSGINRAGNPGAVGNAQSMYAGTTVTGTQGTDTYATGDFRLPKILIPMIRRTFPELITNEIVGVQPMAGPVGLAFALRYRYTGQTLGTNDGAGSPTPYPPSQAAILSGAAGQEAGYQYLQTAYTGTTAAYLSGAQGAYSSLTSWITGGQNYAADGASVDQGIAALLQNYELTNAIPTFEVTFEKTAVEAGTRRLGANWSVELEQDLKNMNGIDIDTELTNAMSYEIQAEIDREMLIRMIQIALNAGFGNGYSVWSPASADGRWLVERNRDFYQRLIIEANRIAVRNRRGAANFVVATPRVAAILEMLPEFQWVPVQGNVNTQPVGVAKVGNLGGRFNVYRDTRTEGNYMAGEYGPQNQGNPRPEYALLGYKGPEFYDTGIIYCPYIPVMVQRTIGQNDFAPRVGLLTRYGVVDNIFGASLYYHVILVSGLGQSFTPATQAVYF
jgi:Major capsid protein Gp23